MEALRTEILTTASKMFGNGWVWLVLDQNRYLRILCTYNAGTPYGAAYRRQDTDMNTRETLGDVTAMTDSIRQSTQGSTSNWAIPLLNINCWEHAWLEDFGVDGKDKYLEKVWDAIDWNVVESRCTFRDSTVVPRKMYSH
jgi:Fe-Mn family superoxide dismutase